MRPIPAPQIIDGVEWTVRDSGESRTAFVDYEKNEMVVPMDGTPVGDLLRAHETTHIAITPRKSTSFYKSLAKEFPNRTMQAAEDARVWLAMKRAGIPTDVSAWDSKAVAKVESLSSRIIMGDTGALEEQARCLLATRGIADHDNLRKVAHPEAIRISDEAFANHFQPYVDRGELPPFEATLDLAREMHNAATSSADGDSGAGEESSSEGEEGRSIGKGKGGGSETAESLETGDADSDEEEEEGEEGESEGESEGSSPEATPEEGGTFSGKSGEGPPEKKESPAGAKDVSRPFTPGDETNVAPKPSSPKATKGEREQIQWALGLRTPGGNGRPIDNSKVTMKTPKLTLSHKGKGFGNKRVSSDSGSLPRSMHRLPVDQAVFGRTIKSGYGTVLIDVSGSMHLTPESVDELVKKLPHSTIAVYSGDGSSGHITIVAQNSKRLAKLPHWPGGNVCDLQAIEWLSKQRGPRHWICDGQVTGYGDELLSTGPMLKIARMLKLHQIRRYRGIYQFLVGDVSGGYGFKLGS
jgi:hypothetical protein